MWKRESGKSRGVRGIDVSPSTDLTGDAGIFNLDGEEFALVLKGLKEALDLDLLSSTSVICVSAFISSTFVY